MNERVELAMALSRFAHKGQVDRAGEEYWKHPYTVFLRVDSDDEDAEIVALLHDVLEDTGVSEDVIRSLFGDAVADAVVCMTKRKDETYEDYILRIKENETAKKVKLKDLEHNMQIDRLSEITKKDEERIQKYKKASETLSE